MAIEKLRLVQIDGAMHDLDRTLLRCSECGYFHPETVATTEKPSGFSHFNEDNPYQTVLNHIREIASSCDMQLVYTKPGENQLEQDASAPSPTDDANAKLQTLQDAIAQNNGAVIQPQQLEELGLTLQDIYSCKYLRAHFGRLPTESVEKFQYYEKQLFLFAPLAIEGDFQWGVYFTTEEHEAEVEDLFASLNFQPAPGDKATGFSPYGEENPYMAVLAQIHEIAAGCKLDLIYTRPEEGAVRTEADDQFLTQFNSQLHTLNVQKQALLDAIKQGAGALAQLDHLDRLDVSLDDIFACKYIKVRFGRLPKDSYSKLRYYSDRLFLFAPLDEEGDYQWGVYFTTEEHEATVDDIFSSLFFERIWIPEFVHGVPGQAKSVMETGVSAAKQELAATDELIQELVIANKDSFLEIYSRARFLCDSFELRKYVSVHKDRFRLLGFIPKANQEDLSARLAELPKVEVEFKPQGSDKRLTVPTKIRNNWLFRPFQMFLDMYGTPAYNEIDPTPFLGMTYILLFGIMFGDLGQGIFIALLGLILGKKSGMKDFGGILVRIGCSASVFGLLYGSVFGLEHVLDPFYTGVLGLPGKPVEIMEASTINLLLLSAVALGVVLILCAMLINIGIGVRNKDWEKALFSNNGVAGMVFYLAVLIGAVSMLTGGPNLFNAPYILGLIVLPILVIFLKEPLGKLAEGSRDVKPENGIGSFIIEGFFELFDVVLSFVTNTLSFLRVGGFIISHAGMMSVVLTLAEMVGGGGSIVVMVLGNLFVMALEGFIVGIQSLRLEFYELFSRYFEGQGKPFTPIGVGTPLAD